MRQSFHRDREGPNSLIFMLSAQFHQSLVNTPNQQRDKNFDRRDREATELNLPIVSAHACQAL